ncbi:MAG TPA: glycosyltransferase family A protein [Streptosporangiaceae bacterium]|nr:glycosyltransferase family A protein [Streptosporangiaceae bacterium]
MTGHRISVVVPFYNNADLLGDCLASIAAQTYPDLQVVMVDDGSTDGSAAIARAQAAADPRFELVSVRNGGPGSARNHGVAVAAGEFLAFVDADDLLPAGAYATMLAVLEQSGSDFVSGGVLRLSAAGLGRSGLHARAIKARRLKTHISAAPELFYDISVWNKLFRRSFWDASGLRFPEGMLWEDLVAMTKAHVLARSVDVITDPVYHWRDRDKGAPSITQSRSDAGNFRDRFTALGMIDDFLRTRGTPAMLRQHQHKALVNDLWLYVRDLPGTSADYQAEFAKLAAGYLLRVTPGLTGQLPSTHKLAYHLISAGRQAELIELAGWLDAHPGRTPPMVRVRGRLRADLPLRGERALAIPPEVFRPQWRELDPYVSVESVAWQPGPEPGTQAGSRPAALRITGWAYVPSMDIARRRHTTKLVVLIPRGRRRPPLVLPARQLRRPDVTAASGQDRYSYDWSGFSCDISTRLFRSGRRWLTGSWDCYVLVRGRAAWRPSRLHAAGPLPADPGPREIAPGLTLGAQWTGGRLGVRLGPAPAAEPT